MNFIFIVGADDPEMQLVRELVVAYGHQVVQAYAGGEPVSPSTAYWADEFVPELPEVGVRVWVECGPADRSLPREIVVDHHKPGDPGYDCGPDRYWEGSSLGQICALIGQEPTPYLLLAAAADHCLSEAYRGNCPGITPAAMREWRMIWRANRRGLQLAQAEERLNRAFQVMADLPVLNFMGQEVVDATGLQVPELNEAVSISGRAVLYSRWDVTSRCVKAKLNGASPEATAAWMKLMSDRPEVTLVYGNPNRAYAGAYFTHAENLRA